MTDRSVELWARYREDPSTENRDALIVQYSQFVRYVATRYSSTVPASIDLEDLVSYGMFGLIDAIDKFEPDRGHKFESYAMARIKGAIVDELRQADWVPRRVRAAASAVDRAEAKLVSTLHRQPTHDELAVELGYSPTKLHKVLKQIGGRHVSTIDEQVDWLEDTGGEHASVEVDETRTLLVRTLEVLTEREAIVFLLYYQEKLTLAEIGTVLGVTESRAVQIHTAAVKRVTAQLA